MPLLRDVEEAPESDYVVMESVYGDREHEHTDDRKARLERVIEETIQKKGTLVIPIFSMERTQEILFEINNLVEQKRVPEIPVFLDSPLAIKVTAVYQKYKNYFNEAARKQAQHDNLFEFPRLKYTETKDESKAINRVPAPKIVLAGSGMSHAGRVIHHEHKYLPEKQNTLLFVGYQGVGTLGRLLQSKPRTVKMFGKQMRVRAHIESIKGYSGHAGLSGLTKFIEPIAKDVTKVFCTMGETKSSNFLAQRLRDYYGISAEVPKQGSVVVLQ
jgi:metallo-beta-lactamase family protein